MPDVIEKVEEKALDAANAGPGAEAEVVARLDTEKRERSLEKMAEEKRQRVKKRRAKRIKRIIALIVALVIIGGIVYGMLRLFREEEELEEAATQMIFRGSIQSMVTGWGQTMPKASETITLASGGTVLEVFVSDGDWVTDGDPLYIIDSAAAQTAVEEAESELADAIKQLDNAMKAYDDLIVRAPFSGTLLDAADIKVGDDVAVGRTLGTIVDDKKMKLELYFSYAYKDVIVPGQRTAVSIPSLMNELSGTVSEVNFVRRVTPEGSVLFQAVIELDNPGSLADGMDASATLTGRGGEEIYPYEAGKLEYSRTADVITKAAGPALSANLLSYAQITEGQILLQMGAIGNDEAVAALEAKVKAAREAVDKAVENLGNFNAVSPMTGTVLSCSLIPGEIVPANKAVITIANTGTMIVTANIDEMNIAYVKPGMTCDVIQYGRGDPQYFMGVIESVSLEAKNENGTVYFPAVITVDNPDGALMSGMGVDYSMVASQSDDCLIAPIQAVQYTMAGSCLFVKADAPPEGALDTAELGIEVPEGFYAMPVTIGISDNSTVEILSGVEEGAEVFTQYVPAGSGMGGGPMRAGSVSIMVG